MAASTITRAVWANDSGTPTAPAGDGTIVNNARLQADIYDAIDQLFSGAGSYTTFTFGGLVSFQGLIGNNTLDAPQLSSSQNNYNPTGLSTTFHLRIAASTPVNITGLQGQQDGRIIVVTNLGSSTITFLHENASSSATNRFYLSSGASKALVGQESFILLYDGGSGGAVGPKWRIIGVGL